MHRIAGAQAGGARKTIRVFVLDDHEVVRVGLKDLLAEIAEQMFLSEKTVKNYVSSLLTKLGMQRRSQAAALAARIGGRTGDD